LGSSLDQIDDQDQFPSKKRRTRLRRAINEEEEEDEVMESNRGGVKRDRPETQ
jgi:hypothetical protein